MNNNSPGWFFFPVWGVCVCVLREREHERAREKGVAGRETERK